MYKEIEFTREQLYKRIWEQPVLVIAREIGVSDVTLAKSCRKAGIPLPVLGHWAKVKAGKAMRVPPLPQATSDQFAMMRFSVLVAPPAKPPKIEVQAPPIEVPEALLKPHGLVAELKAATKGKKEDKGVIPLNYHKFLRVRTSIAQLPRALILMDVLIKQLEERGYKVRINEEKAETELVLREGVVSFRLDERTRQTAPPPPPPRPPGRRGEHYYEPWRPAYVLVSTGEFVLEFGRYRLGNCRNTWKDRASRSLESQLPDVLAMPPSWEAELLTRRLADEERQARALKEEQRRIAVARAEAALRQQRSRLVDSLLAWERSERLRTFIAAAAPVIEGTSEGRLWLQWANEQVAMLDPVQVNPTGLVDLEVKLDRYFTGHSDWSKPEKDWWD